MRNENEIKIKKAYWQGVYFALNPTKRQVSREVERQWLTAQAWLAALEWTLVEATDTAAILREKEDLGDWN